MVNVFSLRWLRPPRYFYFVWIVSNCLIFWNTYRLYKGQPQYYYLHQMLGSGLCISRGSGAVLNVSCGLILLPTCKTAATTLRRCLCNTMGRSANYLRSLFNQAEIFHITCAFTIIVASVIHTGAHLVNAVNCSLHYNHKWKDINIANSPEQNPIYLVFKTVPGITGVLMMMILAMMVITSGRWFRIRHFNTFYYSHHFLFVPFLILLIFHPTSGMLKEQTNWRDHSPGNHDDDEIPPPIFTPMKTNTWLWVSIPLAVYLADWSWRKISRRQPVNVTSVVLHQPNVIELVIDRWMSHSQPGQYIFLQSPDISGFQWHPFSFSSCCDLTHSSWTVHMKTNGDWCKQLKRLLLDKEKRTKEVELFVDGPFSSPLTDVLNSKRVICIAGGIGFTPFLSVVHHLIRNGWTGRPERLHIVWCVQTAESLLWASAAIDQLIEDVWASPRPDKLEIRLHVTRQQPSALRNTDPVAIQLERYPNLLRRLEYGRPIWSESFAGWKDIYSRERVNVFSCGPRELNCQVEQMCHSISNFTLACESFA